METFLWPFWACQALPDYGVPRNCLPASALRKIAWLDSTRLFYVSRCAASIYAARHKWRPETGYAIHTSTCLSKVMYSRSKSSSKPSLLMNVASSSPSPLGRKESISICSAKSTLYWDSFL